MRWIVPLIILGILSATFFPIWIAFKVPLSDIWYALLMIVAMALVFSIPFSMAWKAITKQMWKKEVRYATFDGIEGLEYYRDKLEGLSPVEISMLTDLKIETVKDVSALVLQYELKGYLHMEENKIEVFKLDGPDLLNSDRRLLKLLDKKGRLDFTLLSALSEWKQEAYDEVANGKFFTDKAWKKEKKPIWKTLLALLIPLLALIGFILLYNSDVFQNNGEVLAKYVDYPDEYNFIDYMKNEAEFRNTLFAIFALFGLLIYLMAWPLVSFIKMLIGLVTKPKIYRTSLGEEMTEYIYGMKNFIHDFSSLSEKNKEYLSLWDDFLVYAVVLEENEKILKEIFGSRKTGKVEVKVSQSLLKDLLKLAQTGRGLS